MRIIISDNSIKAPAQSPTKPPSLFTQKRRQRMSSNVKARMMTNPSRKGRKKSTQTTTKKINKKAVFLGSFSANTDPVPFERT